MQDSLTSLRTLLQNKEYIIQNLILRMELGDIGTDTSVTKHKTPQELQSNQTTDIIRKKTEALTKRTILENFELRVCKISQCEF